MRLAPVLILFTFLVLLPGGEDAAAWPCFRGPSRDGISPETGLLKTWPDGGPRLLWHREDCGQGYAGVVIADGTVLTAGTTKDVGHEIIALDLAGGPRWRTVNGTARWRPARDKRKWAQVYGGVRGTPTIAEGRVYQLSVNGRLACLDLVDGVELWTVDVRDRFGGRPNEWGYSESVLVAGGRLYCLPGGTKGFAACLDAASGDTLWTCDAVEDKQASNASGTLVTIDGVEQFVTMTTVLVVGIRAQDGKLLWSFRHANRFRENCEVPLWAKDLLIVSSGYGHGTEAWRIERDGEDAWTAEQCWRTNQADNLHGGHVVLGGHLYGAAYEKRNKAAYCLDLADGSFRWKDQQVWRSSFTAAEGLLYRLGEDGVMALERPNPERREVVSTFRLPSAAKGEAGKCLTHPVVCGGRLYIRQQRHLYCYDIAAPTDPAQP